MNSNEQEPNTDLPIDDFNNWGWLHIDRSTTVKKKTPLQSDTAHPFILSPASAIVLADPIYVTDPRFNIVLMLDIEGDCVISQFDKKRFVMLSKEGHDKVKFDIVAQLGYVAVDTGTLCFVDLATAKRWSATTQEKILAEADTPSSVKFRTLHGGGGYIAFALMNGSHTVAMAVCLDFFADIDFAAYWKAF